MFLNVLGFRGRSPVIGVEAQSAVHQRPLGTLPVSFTMQTYAHVLPHVQREAAAKMDQILNPEPVATSVATKPVTGTAV